MINPLLLLLLLFQPVVQSFQFENSACIDTPNGPQSWLCFVNGECAEASSAPKLLKPYPPSLQGEDKCQTMVQIRKIHDKRDIVILKARVKDGETLQEFSLSIKSEVKLGCKVNGDRMEPIVEREVMELNELSSAIHEKVYTCAGYVTKSDENAKIADNLNKMKVTITLAGATAAAAATTTEYTGVPLAIDKEYPGCDPFLANTMWKEQEFDVDYLNKNKIILPPNDKMDNCQGHGGPTFGLFYKKYLDARPVPVKSFSCDSSNSANSVYKIEIDSHQTVTTSQPFLLFCAEHVNTKCALPTHLNCANCTEVPTGVYDGHSGGFETGKAFEAAKFKCPDHSYVVKVGGREQPVAGEPFCQANPADMKTPVWAIPSLQGDPLLFTAAACHTGLNCWMKNPLQSTCNDDDTDCSQATIAHSGAFCPNGSYVGIYKDSTLEETKSQVISCDTIRKEWNPIIVDTKNVSCYFNKDRQPIEGKSSWTKQKIVFICVIFVNILLVLLSITSFSCYFFVFKKRAAAKKKRQAALRTPLVIRMEQCPGVEERLLRRRNEKNPLLFENLALVRADYLDDVTMDEFEHYSIHERAKFAENMADGLGSATPMDFYLQLFWRCFKTEVEFAVWYHFVTGIRIVCIALKFNEGLKVRQRLMALLGQFGFKILVKYGDYPKPQGESDNVILMRSLAYYTLLYIKCNDVVEKCGTMHDTMLGEVVPSLRRIVWTALVRNEKGRWEEIKEMLDKELATPSRAGETRWGTKREDMIYALCSTPERDLNEPLLNTVIREPQFTAKEVLAGFTSMVRDFDDCHDGAKFLFVERHAMIKAKMPVATAEYKQLFQMFYQFATIALSNDEWIVKFISDEKTYTPEERKEMDSHLARALEYGEMYKHIHEMCFDKENEVDIRTTLGEMEPFYIQYV